MANDLKTLLIAHGASPELASLRETIASLAAQPSGGSGTTAEQNRTMFSLDDALAEIQDGWFPNLVIVYQGIPDEFPQSRIDKFIGLLPLARFIIAFGPWCESIGRTEQRWPIAWCIPIRHLETRLAREFSTLRDGRPASPATASRDEMFSRTAARVNSVCFAKANQTALIIGSDRHFVETVQNQLQALGIAVVSDGEMPPDFVFFSVTRISDAVWIELSELQKQFPHASRILISDLLTSGELALIRGQGVFPFSQLRFGEELAGFLETRFALRDA